MNLIVVKPIPGSRVDHYATDREVYKVPIQKKSIIKILKAENNGKFLLEPDYESFEVFLESCERLGEDARGSMRVDYEDDTWSWKA